MNLVAVPTVSCLTLPGSTPLAEAAHRAGNLGLADPVTVVDEEGRPLGTLGARHWLGLCTGASDVSVGEVADPVLVLPADTPLAELDLPDGRWIARVDAAGRLNGLVSPALVVRLRAEVQGQEIARLEARQPDYDSVLEHIGDSVFIADAEGKVLTVSERSCIWLNMPREKLLGSNVRDLQQQGAFTPSLTLRVIASRQPESAVQITRTGTRLDTRAIPVLAPDGKLLRVICVGRDISEVARLREQLRTAEEDAQRYRQELARLQAVQVDGAELIAESPAMRQTVSTAVRVAAVDSTVLLLGESGVGKEVLARFVHQVSKRRNGPMIKIHCGAIPEALLESELFGYERGAFTGARSDGKVGLVELADKGTLFLDEIGELPLVLQVKLLQVIQEHRFMRVGGSKWINADMRIIAATNRDLIYMVRKGMFREDLYYRLNVVPVQIPSLRERVEEIMPLAEHFLQRVNRKYGLDKRWAPETLALLARYSWPGNVRELENLVERLAVMVEGDTLRAHHLPEAQRLGGLQAASPLRVLPPLAQEAGGPVRVTAVLPFKEAQEAFETALLRLAAAQLGSTRQIARVLGVNQSTVARKLRKYGASLAE